jgi:arylsulfatase A-like enzyme/Flp pilus assembly protein TadD
VTSRRLLIGVITSLIAVSTTTTCRRDERPASYSGAPVIIISIDTLRADRLPMYGYKNVETPNLQALRDDSTLYTNAYANVPLTFPSHVAMLTGLLPPQSKVRNNIGYHLDPSLPTIPKVLESRGYVSGAAVSAYVLRGNVGLAPSFDFYEDNIVTKANVPVGNLQRSGSETVAVANRWINQQKDRPFFFLLHLFEPHSPYAPLEPFRTRYSDAYDGEIATADQIVGDFLEQLKNEGLYDKAIIILMSDHGEGLYDHGEPEHGVFLYRECIHVPLMLKLPKNAGAGETISRPVTLIDIFPTIAELTDTPAPPNLTGKSLLRGGEDAQRSIYAETLYPRIHLGWSELRSIVGSEYQFIQAPRPELYNIRRDPAEKQNVLSDERRVYASMREQLARYGSEVELPTRIDPEEAKKLAALGYLGSIQPAGSGPLPDPKDRIGEIASMLDAMRFAMNGQHAKAVRGFRNILEKNPRLADAWNQLGTSLESMGRYEEAAEAYRKAITVTPELSGEFGLRLGAILLKLNRFDEAEKHAELGESTNSGGSHYLRARIALARKNYARAESEAKIAQADQYSHAAATVLLAQVYAQQDRAQEAYAIAEQIAKEAEVRKLGPVESLEFARGDALARLERYDEAIEAFRREIANFPQNRNAYGSLYLVYMLTDRPSEAREALEQMVEANPNRRAFVFAAETTEAVGDRRAATAWRRRADAVR